MDVSLNEASKQGKGNCTQDNSFFQRKEKRAALGGILTHDTLLCISNIRK